MYQLSDGVEFVHFQFLLVRTVLVLPVDEDARNPAVPALLCRQTAMMDVHGGIAVT